MLAALLLYFPANFLPIMQLNLLGRVTHDTVWSGVLSLYNSGMQGIAVVVFLCSMAVPLMKLLCQLAVLLCIAIDRAKPWGCCFTGSITICASGDARGLSARNPGFHHQAA